MRHPVARIPLVVFVAITEAAVIVMYAQQAAPARDPLAPEKYKNIQVLTDVPARQILSTMDYFAAATSFGCADCHQRGKPGEQMPTEIDTPRKNRARDMIRMVKAFNAANYGVTITCATCHNGHTRPPGIEMMTPERFATIAANITAAAARGAGPAPPASNSAPAPPEPAPPTADAVLSRYFDAIGGRAAVDALVSTVTSATLQNVGTPQKADMSIDRQREKFLVSILVPPSTQASRIGFDGVTGWLANGTTVTDVPERTLQKISQLTTPVLSSRVLGGYANLKTERSQPLRLTPAASPIAVNVVVASLGPDVTERFSFDAATGLLLRRASTTRVALGGMIEEWIDYSDYQPFAGVKLPRVLTQTTSSIITTVTVTDIKTPAASDEARFARPKGASGGS